MRMLDAQIALPDILRPQKSVSPVTMAELISPRTMNEACARMRGWIYLPRSLTAGSQTWGFRGGLSELGDAVTLTWEVEMTLLSCVVSGTWSPEMDSEVQRGRLQR